jgi:heme exporter protein B
VVLFASVNAVAKSFIQENSARQLYYYALARPSAVLFSKIIYNTALLFFIGLLSLFVLSVVLGNPVKHQGLFLGAVALGSLGFSIAFTFLSAIAAKARQSATLMAILSFPIILPTLLTLMRLSKIALALMHDSAYYKDVFILLAIDLILLSIASLLFPYLWKD